MSLYEQWKEIANKERSEEHYNSFWSGYFEKEKKNYEYILEKDVLPQDLIELELYFSKQPLNYSILPKSLQVLRVSKSFVGNGICHCPVIINSLYS